MRIYQLVQGDQAPQIQAVLTRDDDGSVIDFSGGSCALKFRAKGSTSLLYTIDGAGDFSVGTVVFMFTGNQLDIDEGYYQGEIEITHSNGNVETVFQILDFYLRADF